MRKDNQKALAAKYGLSKPSEKLIAYKVIDSKLIITHIYPSGEINEREIDLKCGHSVCQSISFYRKYKNIVAVLANAVFEIEFDKYWYSRCLPKLETAKRYSVAMALRNRTPKTDDSPANPEHVVNRILRNGKGGILGELFGG